ncbi:gamma-glutamylaminecyclotransferase isoform X1 [Dermacentor silvarum]|uniref:gamma-glutamylaminecyclotransferase isoform X1 n=1 Tax=Dermacentor silvarum TaxID=543639 RepID=UPI0018994792|nr:gamma-glutamylaminecyclotransferase isoform X1 [Dermacentor silvarum]
MLTAALPRLLCVRSRGVRFLTIMACQNTHNIFVYGTLKTGEPNNYFMKDSNNGKATLIGTAVTVKKWPLVIASSYNIPYLLHCEGKGHSISGELYSVDDKMLAMLDDFESHPKYYVRSEEEIELLASKSNDEKTKKKIKAWIYFLKDYREELLQRPYLANYSSKGDHGLEYVPRYLRQAQDPKNLHTQDVLLKGAISCDKQ